MATDVFSEVDLLPSDGNLPDLQQRESMIERWFDQIDDWCERMGDRLNPILVKETRQALKSRQFMVTFSVLLFAALAWTIVGSLSQMPNIYTTPSAARLLIGYYIVLAIPMLMVVPLAAYRSLEVEIDDGTLELLSITSLSAWQIVLGKLASATLQMMLYFIALFPCVAYAYTLRGVDLPTTMLMIAILLIAALALTVAGLFLAPLARSRTGRISTLLLLLLVVLGAQYLVSILVVGMIIYGNPLPANIFFFIAASVTITAVALSHLLLTATAAQLTPESENRSTHLRISMLVLTSVLVGCAAYSLFAFPEFDGGVFGGIAVFLAMFWTLCGSLVVAESGIMTPRIRRELPGNLVSRAFLTWLTPGPATGLVFATSVVIVLAVIAWIAIDVMLDAGLMRTNIASAYRRFLVLFSSYLIGSLIAVRSVVAIVRINNHPRVEIGMAAMVAVLVLSALVPYSVGMHLNDYRPYGYSRWQITNWAWTLEQSGPGGAVNSSDVYLVASAVGVAFFVCLVSMPRVVLPRKIAIPERVQAEQSAKSEQS